MNFVPEFLHDQVFWDWNIKKFHRVALFGNKNTEGGIFCYDRDVTERKLAVYD